MLIIHRGAQVVTIRASFFCSRLFGCFVRSLYICNIISLDESLFIFKELLGASAVIVGAPFSYIRENARLRARARFPYQDGRFYILLKRRYLTRNLIKITSWPSIHPQHACQRGAN